MTHKEIANRLREAADDSTRPIRHFAREFANELDPPKSKPGEAVLFRPLITENWMRGFSAT